jgi:hypothetical protein
MRSLVKELFGDLTPTGRAWMYLGLGSLMAAAAMSFDFGSGVSMKHAIFLGCLTVVTAFAPEAAYKQWTEGRRGLAVALAIICAPLFAIEFYSHAGYTAGLRGQNISEARVQNARYDGAQEAAKEDKTNLELWKKQLATLLEQNAWAGTVKADALRAQVDVAQKEIDLEAARGGCKTKCALRMKEKADLEQKIGTIEQASSLSARIEATQRILDKKRVVASSTEYKSSAVAHQNEFLAKAVTLFRDGSMKPSELMDEGASQTVNLGMAAAGTGLPAFALFIAGLFRRKESEDGSASPSARPIPGAQRPIIPAFVSPVSVPTVIPVQAPAARHVADPVYAYGGAPSVSCEGNSEFGDERHVVERLQDQCCLITDAGVTDAGATDCGCSSMSPAI